MNEVEVATHGGPVPVSHSSRATSLCSVPSNIHSPQPSVTLLSPCEGTWESGGPELILFGVDDGAFISVSDASGKASLPRSKGEAVFHGCSSTINLPIEASVAYNPCGVFVWLNAYVVAWVRALDGSGNASVPPLHPALAPAQKLHQCIAVCTHKVCI